MQLFPRTGSAAIANIIGGVVCVGCICWCSNNRFATICTVRVSLSSVKAEDCSYLIVTNIAICSHLSFSFLSCSSYALAV